MRPDMMKRLLAVLMFLAGPASAQITLPSTAPGSSGGSVTIDSLASATSCTDAVGTDAYACNFSPAPASLAAMRGAVVTFFTPTANTGAATFAPNGFAATPIVKVGLLSTSALVTGDIRANTNVTVVYNGTSFECLSCDGNQASLNIANTWAAGQTFNGITTFGTSVLARAMYQYGIVTAVTTTKTTAISEGNETITNTGDTDGSTITLMNDPTVGGYWNFAVTAAQTLTIVASAGETLMHGASTCGTSLTSNTIGSTILIRAVIGGSGGTFMTFGSTGTWVCNA